MEKILEWTEKTKEWLSWEYLAEVEETQKAQEGASIAELEKRGYILFSCHFFFLLIIDGFLLKCLLISFCQFFCCLYGS